MRHKPRLLGGVGLGASLLYLLDPERGPHRRLLLRHCVTSVMDATATMLRSIGRDHSIHPSGVAAWSRARACHETERSPGGAGEQSRLHNFFPAVHGMTPVKHSRQKISLWVKVSYTVFLCVLTPVYLVKYGPGNFLWFSDIALVVTLVALWRESPLLASTQAVSVVLLESVWILDFLLGVVSGESPLGLAAYMFDPKLSLFLRALSLFHLVLPPLLVWLVFRLGYDRRAWVVQTLAAWVILPLCYFLTAPSANINWVFGPGNEPQTWMPPSFYFLLVMAFFPLGVYLPTHLLFQWLCSRPRSCGSEAGKAPSLAHMSCDRKETHADL